MTRFERKLYIDENIVYLASEAIGQVYRRYWFGNPRTEHLDTGVKDLELFETLKAMDYRTIITMDGMQLERRDERQALADCGLHWIGFQMGRSQGSNALASQVATILHGLPLVFDDWREEPTAYHLPALKATTLSTEPLGDNR